MRPEAYPLAWPETWARTPGGRRKRASFGDFTFARNRDEVLRELRLLKASGVVLSTNLPLRQDGLPYASGPTREARDDPGVAVHFRWRGKPYVIACDTYTRVEDNARAIAKTIEAMRAIERHGASQLLERAVSGFTALPGAGESAHAPPPPKPWWEALGIPKMDGVEFQEVAEDEHHPMRVPLLKMAEALYKTKVVKAHPDRGGSSEQMWELNRAIREVRAVLGKEEKRE
jgi:hypothetical protein